MAEMQRMNWASLFIQELVPFRAENQSGPHPPIEILVPFWGSFLNF